MEHNIPEIHTSRKVRELILFVTLILLAVCSFGLGRLSVSTATPRPVALCMHSCLGQETEETGTSYSYTQGTYVASKNSSVYHFPWCSGAKRISDENKISFTTKEEAEQAGYRPAANCKGL